MALDWFEDRAKDVGNFFKEEGEEVYHELKEVTNETIKFVSNDTIEGTDDLWNGIVETSKTLFGAGQSTVNFGFDGIEGSGDLLSDGLLGGVHLVGSSLDKGINIAGGGLIGFYGSIPETGFTPMDSIGDALADIPITGTNVITVGATDVVSDGTRTGEATVDDLMDSLGKDAIQPIQDGWNDAMQHVGFPSDSMSYKVGDTFQLPENNEQGFAVFKSVKNKKLPDVFTASKKLKSSTNEFINS